MNMGTRLYIRLVQPRSILPVSCLCPRSALFSGRAEAASLGPPRAVRADCQAGKRTILELSLESEKGKNRDNPRSANGPSSREKATLSFVFLVRNNSWTFLHCLSVKIAFLLPINQTFSVQKRKLVGVRRWCSDISQVCNRILWR